MTAAVEHKAAEILESRTGRVEIREHADGWTIVGGSRIWWLNDGETPWGRFTVEIRRCDHTEGVLTRTWPVCTKFHSGCKGKCHELGHIER
ncbi:MAG: hypothetical protein ACOC9R_05305, partial [bacterium]